MGNIIGNIGQALHSAVATVQQRFMPQQPVAKPPPLKIAPPPPKYQVKTNLPQPNFTSNQPAPSAKPVYKPPPAPLNLPAKVPLKLNTAGLNTNVGTAINPAGKTVSSYKPLPVVQPKPIVPPGTPFKINTTGVNTRIGTGYKQTSINTAFGVPNTYKPEPFSPPKNPLTRDVATVGNIIKTGVIQPLARTAMRIQTLDTGQTGKTITPKGDIAKFFLGNKAFSTSVVQTGREMLQDQGVTKETAGKVNPLLAGGIGVAGILGEISNIIPVKGAEAAAAKEGLALVKGAKTADEAMAALKAARPEVQDAVHNILVNPNTKIKTLKDLHTALNNEVLDQATQKGRVILSRNTMTRANTATKTEDANLLKPFNKKAEELPSEVKTPEQIRESSKSQSLPTELNQKSSSGGSVPPQSDPVKAVIKALGEAKPIRGAQETFYSQERAQRFAKAQSVGQRVGGEKGFYAQLGQMKGALPKAEYESIKGSLTQAHIDALYQQIRSTSHLNVGEQLNAQQGLSKLLGAEGGSVPTEGEIKLLGQVFGNDFVKVVLDKRPFIQKLFSTTEDVLSIPRSLMATADFSASLRQAIFAAPRHPVLFSKAFGSQFKYAFSEKQFQGLYKSIREGKNYELMKRGELAITDAGHFMDNREEKYASSLAEKIPIVKYVVRGSDRAYTGLLTKFRSDLFNSMVENAKIVGTNIEHNPKQLKAIGHFVNTITGRGQIDSIPGAKSVSGFLNATLFSPRLLASRMNLLNPAYYATQPKGVRQEALKTLFAFTATVLGVLGAVKVGTNAAGKPVQIETDPTSADFGKIKVGNTRYEITGGFQPYVRLAAQLIAGQTKSTTTGKITTLGKGYKATTRGDEVASFLRNKENPILSFATDLATGKNSIGQPFDLKSEVASRFIPLLAQDAYDIFKDRGFSQTIGVAPGIFGVGVQTYGGTPQSLQDAKQQGGAQLYNYLKSIPKDQANKYLKDNTAITDSEFNKIKTYKKIDDAGLSKQEYNLVGTGVQNGERSKLIWDKVKDMKTNNEKNAYINKLDSAGLINDTIFSQLKDLAGKAKITPTPQAETKTTTLSSWGQFKQIADTLGKKYDFPSKVIKAVAANESARGTSTYAKDRNNFFGYNAVDSNPDLATKFPTVEAGIKAYIDLIKQKYPAAYAARSDPDKMIALIKAGGYASDPNYVSTVTGTPEWNQ